MTNPTRPTANSPEIVDLDLVNSLARGELPQDRADQVRQWICGSPRWQIAYTQAVTQRFLETGGMNAWREEQGRRFLESLTKDPDPNLEECDDALGREQFRPQRS